MISPWPVGGGRIRLIVDTIRREMWRKMHYVAIGLCTIVFASYVNEVLSSMWGLIGKAITVGIVACICVCLCAGSRIWKWLAKLLSSLWMPFAPWYSLVSTVIGGAFSVGLSIVSGLGTALSFGLSIFSFLGVSGPISSLFGICGGATSFCKRALGLLSRCVPSLPSLGRLPNFGVSLPKWRWPSFGKWGSGLWRRSRKPDTKAADEDDGPSLDAAVLAHGQEQYASQSVAERRKLFDKPFVQSYVAPEKPPVVPEPPSVAPEEPPVSPEPPSPSVAPEEPPVSSEPPSPTVAPEEPPVSSEPTSVAPEKPPVAPETPPMVVDDGANARHLQKAYKIIQHLATQYVATQDTPYAHLTNNAEDKALAIRFNELYQWCIQKRGVADTNEYIQEGVMHGALRKALQMMENAKREDEETQAAETAKQAAEKAKNLTKCVTIAEQYSSDSDNDKIHEVATWMSTTFSDTGSSEELNTLLSATTVAQRHDALQKIEPSLEQKCTGEDEVYRLKLLLNNEEMCKKYLGSAMRTDIAVNPTGDKVASLNAQVEHQTDFEEKD